jgi:methionine biosynthesis protein MetW
MRTSASKVYSYKKGNPYVINLVPEQAKLILDIGCGAGDTGSILMEQGYTVDGITISEDEKREAGQVLRNVYVYNVEQGLPQELQEQYDVVILSHVLEHICYPQKLLKDIQSRLKPNGILIIALPNLMHFNSRWKLTKGNFNYEEYGIWDYTHFRWYTFKSAQQMLKDNNYTVEKADVSGWIPFEHRLKKITPAGLRNGIFKMLKKISPGLFGFQLLYVAKPANRS